MASPNRDTLIRKRSSPGHQISFNPNWTWRDVVAVLVIALAVPETAEGVNIISL